MGFDSSCDSHHHLHLVVISVFQRYKTDFSTSIGWYINIISGSLLFFYRTFDRIVIIIFLQTFTLTKSNTERKIIVHCSISNQEQKDNKCILNCAS